MDLLDPAACYRALKARDARFDGRFFVGVTSTGIYCRPICPAGGVKFENCRFFRSAAAAEAEGFRPCLRCRPELAPGSGGWRGTSSTVARALKLIAAGALDGPGADVGALAARLGLGDRQLRRLFDQHLGASPLAVAQTRRTLIAKQLLQDTRLPMTDVALAAGFGSVRRFNETFKKLVGRPPASLRSARVRASTTPVSVRLRYRPPYDWDGVLAFLRARAIPGVEQVGPDFYARTAREGDVSGVVEVRHQPERHQLVVSAHFSSVQALPALLDRVRHVFDLDVDIEAVARHLRRDELLAGVLDERPGLRVPGGWDGFEVAMRAILGQQVALGAGVRLAGKLVELCGEPLGEGGGELLRRTFPTPARVLAADLSSLGMPGARRAALRALAAAAHEDPQLFHAYASLDAAVQRLREIPGVGEWTAQYIALRGLRETDAFPAGDVALLKGAGRDGARPTQAELLERAERWRPWRAYAAQCLWSAGASSARPRSDHAASG